MRGAADIACNPAPPSNLERARVIDVLLWASELHGRLRRSPRVPAQIPVLFAFRVRQPSLGGKDRDDDAEPSR